MIYNCGTVNDIRSLDILLPKTPSKIGVFVSGGIDSAILYYILNLENKNQIHEIIPLSIMRKEGSKYFSHLVVAHINEELGLPIIKPMIVGKPNLPDDQQVRSGVMEAFQKSFDFVYVGVIEQLAMHMIGWENIPANETEKFKTPLAKLNKSHIIDLVTNLNQQSLFNITHSCSKYELGRCNACNGCNERAWAFEQLNYKDPGRL
jgi:diphthamide synthase (EF-2-diphthine--ammonia ligase)